MQCEHSRWSAAAKVSKPNSCLTAADRLVRNSLPPPERNRSGRRYDRGNVRRMGAQPRAHGDLLAFVAQQKNSWLTYRNREFRETNCAAIYSPCSTAPWILRFRVRSGIRPRRGGAELMVRRQSCNVLRIGAAVRHSCSHPHVVMAKLGTCEQYCDSFAQVPQLLWQYEARDRRRQQSGQSVRMPGADASDMCVVGEPYLV
jgi:hypothetical protein